MGLTLKKKEPRWRSPPRLSSHDFKKMTRGRAVALMLAGGVVANRGEEEWRWQEGCAGRRQEQNVAGGVRSLASGSKITRGRAVPARLNCDSKQCEVERTAGG